MELQSKLPDNVQHWTYEEPKLQVAVAEVF
jgi:hypothetical protein